jgi:hypothetical protein
VSGAKRSGSEILTPSYRKKFSAATAFGIRAGSAPDNLTQRFSSSPIKPESKAASWRALRHSPLDGSSRRVFETDQKIGAGTKERSCTYFRDAARRDTFRASAGLTFFALRHAFDGLKRFLPPEMRFVATTMKPLPPTTPPLTYPRSRCHPPISTDACRAT